MTSLARGVEGLKELVDRELGPSEWLTIDQERIDAFAAATDDPQWIHTDPERAAQGPFGTTVAHGFLTLSLLVRLWTEVVQVEGASLAVNYGVDRVRFPAPVAAGARVRARFVVEDVIDVPGGVQARILATAEGDGQTKPVCVAQLVLRFLA